jgi:hypothetical protein
MVPSAHWVGDGGSAHGFAGGVDDVDLGAAEL